MVKAEKLFGRIFIKIFIACKQTTVDHGFCVKIKLRIRKLKFFAVRMTI